METRRISRRGFMATDVSDDTRLSLNSFFDCILNDRSPNYQILSNGSRRVSLGD